MIHDFKVSFDLIKSTDTVAHELAHVYRYATIDRKQLMEESVETCETETIAIAEGWGFPQTSFNPRAYGTAKKARRKRRPAGGDQDVRGQRVRIIS